ncbi:MAG: CCA tRNA nucleotidyltransferase [Candidatus Undinarchaeales archaeon]
MDKILSKVLKRTVPSKKEEKKIKEFADSVISKIKENNHDAELEGSLAKGTWNAGSHDLDIFIFFDNKISRETLEKEGIRIGKKIIKEYGAEPEIAYAEHPYVKSEINNFELDIVPCYTHKKLECLKSAVDRTPFHTKYIKEKLSEKQKNEVRLLKRFMKGIGVYSARESVHGFSGYLCELLILKYETFKKTIKSAKNWEHGLVIDIENYYENEKTLKNKFDHALIVIDPIDKDRNVAAALKKNNFDLFIFAVNEFLKEPKINFFYPNPVEPLSKKVLKKEFKKRSPIFFVKFKAPDLIEDTLYAQLRSSLHSLTSAMKRKDFEFLGSDFFVNNHAYFLLDLEYDELPEVKRLEGPPTSVSKEDQDAFVQKYKKFDPWLEDERWYVEVPRKLTSAKSAISYIIKNPRKHGLAKSISKSLKKNSTIIKDLNITADYEGDFAKCLTVYLTKKKPWEW